ncbi:hypothetical protein MBOVa_4130 [Mycoplasmopsis bovis 8790]|nr:hypothetical protein MBOVa_4130 [Mycoplasmopsis bovis 8790]
MAEKVEKVIVLKIEEYTQNENAALVTVLGTNGVFKLFAPGITKTISKNRQNLQIGSICEIEYFKARFVNKLNKLKKANLLILPHYEDNLVLKFIAKMVLFLENFNDNAKEVFDAYVECLLKYDHYVKNGFEDLETKDNPLRYMITYLVSKALKYNGIQPNHHRCISCNSPANLIDFKFSEGGFICGECTSNQRWTKELKSFYFLFNSLDKYILMSNKAVNDIIYNEIINHLIKNGIFVNWEILKFNK